MILFSYEIRVIEDEAGQPWLVAKDVCDVLGVGNPTGVLRPLDEDEKSTLRSSEGGPGGTQETTIINESGLYSLIMRSNNKPQAKPFRKWVTSEVLPLIRKTDIYTAQQVDKGSPQVWGEL